MIFKSTHQILNNPWKEDVPNIDPFPAVKPPTTFWKSDSPIELSDVVLWEQIYYEPGVIGVYAAWDPNEEFYLVTYNFFLEENAGYKTFYGDNCVNRVIEELDFMGIKLPVRTIKVS
jgi:hypothetical protein